MLAQHPDRSKCAMLRDDAPNPLPAESPPSRRQRYTPRPTDRASLALQGNERYAGRMDRDLETLRKTREHVADVATLAEMAKEHLEEGRFEDASACLRLIEQHAAIGREGIGPLIDR